MTTVTKDAPSAPVDGEIVEAPSRALSVPSTRHVASEASEWTPRMSMTITEAVDQIDQRREFMARVLMQVQDAIVTIPGASKAVLGKPGAETLVAAYGLHPELADETPPTLDYTGHDHGGEPFIEFRRQCSIWRQTGSGPDDRMLIARASGSCNSWETKYRWRQSERECPNCTKPTIIPGRAEYGGGWLCFAKRGGCGAKFPIDDPRVAGQNVGRVANPEVFDQINTILKMADKRALVAATIIATGWSSLVTQDLDDMPSPAVATAAPPTRPEPAAARPSENLGGCPQPECDGRKVRRTAKKGPHTGKPFVACDTCKWVDFNFFRGGDGPETADPNDQTEIPMSSAPLSNASEHVKALHAALHSDLTPAQRTMALHEVGLPPSGTLVELASLDEAALSTLRDRMIALAARS